MLQLINEIRDNAAAASDLRSQHQTKKIFSSISTMTAGMFQYKKEVKGKDIEAVKKVFVPMFPYFYLQEHDLGDESSQHAAKRFNLSNVECNFYHPNLRAESDKDDE